MPLALGLTPFFAETIYRSLLYGQSVAQGETGVKQVNMPFRMTQFQFPVGLACIMDGVADPAQAPPLCHDSGHEGLCLFKGVDTHDTDRAAHLWS